MNFLVTGANGFIGKHFISYLKYLNRNIFTIGRMPVEDLEANFFSINEINNNKFNDFLINAEIDYFIHLAGNPNLLNIVDNNFINCDLGLKILKKIRTIYKNKVIKCILFGSAAEYGILKISSPINEMQLANPNSDYGISKIRQTKEAMAWANHEHQVLVIRPFSILGENMPKNSAFGSFIDQVQNKKSEYIKTGNLDVYRDFIDINDLIKFTWKLIFNNNSYGNIVNICSGKPLHLLEMVKYMNSCIKKPKKIKQIPNKKLDKIPKVVFGDNTLLLSLVEKTSLIDWKVSLKRILNEV